MSKRSNWCEFSTKEREIIYERDNMRCIYCGDRMGLGVAHIFVSKAHGGKGCKENGVLLCQKCHTSLDNGNDKIKREKIGSFCEKYLIREYKVIDLKKIIFSK